MSFILRKALKEISVGELKEDETFNAKHEADLLAKVYIDFLPNFYKLYTVLLLGEHRIGENALLENVDGGLIKIVPSTRTYSILVLHEILKMVIRIY